ncbi:hypothetical protein BASA81_000748 [Batrachochytrium salamandrivorans]|nr:hypothetical protein BASA81_000748 [Batrachochytrium salamandrivorans]
MWVPVSYNRIFYQNGNWQDNHFIELDNGMLLCYEVSKTPSGKLAKVLSLTFDHLAVKLVFENEVGETRSVVVLCGSIRSRTLLVHFLNTTTPSTADSDQVLFETVLIKYPTEGGGGGDKPNIASSPSSASLSVKRDSQRLRADSLVSAKLDELTTYMGSSQRRLFKLYANGSLAYFEVSPVAVVSVSSSSSLLRLLESPQEYNGDGVPMHAITVSSFSQDATLPQPPPSANTNNPLRVLHRKLFANQPIDDSGGSSLPSTITFGTSLGRTTCEQWLAEIQSYSAWFHQEFAKDSLDRKRAKVLLKGWCWKRGQFNLLNYQWKLRFLLVLSNKEICYYDAELGGSLLGAIPLTKMRSIKIGRSPDKPQGFSDIIELDTLGRTWYLSPRATNRSEQAILLDRWISTIRDLVAGPDDEEEGETVKRASSLKSPAQGYSPQAFFASPPSGTDLPCVPITTFCCGARAC